MIGSTRNTADADAPSPSGSGAAGETSLRSGLEAAGVRVTFGSLVALDDVDICVPPATIVGLVGPNGAGKTTLMAVLYGFLRPGRGHVRLDARDITHVSPQHRARMGIARTFQQPALFAGMTVREHLLLADRVHRHRRRIWGDFFTFRALRSMPWDDEEGDRVEELLDDLGLLEAADQPVDRLPLGHSRLVEVGRALAAEPHTVLLDEPASGLDAAETAHLRSVLERFRAERGVAFLLIDHDVETVLGVSSHVCVLDFGRVLATGTPREVANDPIVREAYLGSATMGGVS
jgi:ABC-type branched-subunit amino acid transport system ATPase component